jgi:transposase
MKKYDEEFKREAVRKVFDGQTVRSVSRELGVSENQIHNWKKRIRETNSDDANEVIALKRKLREVEMERDILKKAALIFGRAGGQ